MYIIGGEKSGQKIYGPGPKEIRPIQHLVRKALFDMLRQVMENASFLDLFAGTGSVGLEALSEGAKNCTFVDRSSRSIELISKNVDTLDYTDRSNIYKDEVSVALEKFNDRARYFDIAFVGPPYDTNLAQTTMDHLDRINVIKPGGIVVVEVFFKDELSDDCDNYNRIESREYGQTKLNFYRRSLHQDTN